MKNIKNFKQFIINEETDGSTTGTVGSGTAVGGGAEGNFVSSAGVSVGGGDSASSFNVGSSGSAYGSLGSISGMGDVVSPQPSDIPGSVAGSTKGSGDISKGGMTYSKIAAGRKKKKKKSDYSEKITRLDKLYVTNYKEGYDKNGNLQTSWKTFNENIQNDTMFIYNIKQNDNGEFEFEQNNEQIIKLIKQNIPEISDNEIDRFMAFTFQDIIDNIPDYFYKQDDKQKINRLIKSEIYKASKHWMGMNSDRVMKSLFNRTFKNI